MTPPPAQPAQPAQPLPQPQPHKCIHTGCLLDARRGLYCNPCHKRHHKRQAQHARKFKAGVPLHEAYPAYEDFTPGVKKWCLLQMLTWLELHPSREAPI